MKKYVLVMTLALLAASLVKADLTSTTPSAAVAKKVVEEVKSMTIRGRLADYTNEKTPVPVANLRVTITSQGQPIAASTKSAADGTFEFANVPTPTNGFVIEVRHKDGDQYPTEVERVDTVPVGQAELNLYPMNIRAGATATVTAPAPAPVPAPVPATDQAG